MREPLLSNYSITPSWRNNNNNERHPEQEKYRLGIFFVLQIYYKIFKNNKFELIIFSFKNN